MLGLASEPAILLAERLMRIVPPGLTKVFYSDAGATATEIAFKLAAQYWYNVGRPEKNEFVGFAEAYHGDTVGAMCVGRMPAFHKPYFPMLFKVHFAPSPYVYRWRTLQPHGDGDGESVKEQCLRRWKASSAVMLPESPPSASSQWCRAAAGMIVQPPGFSPQSRRSRSGTTSCSSPTRSPTGFGRTGRMFACEHEGVSPDLMCVAKGITGGYLPLAATFATQRIFDAFLGEPWEGRTFYHGHTYTGNPLACAAALALAGSVRAQPCRRERRDERPEARRDARPSCATCPHVGDVRQLGYMVGIELVEDRATRRPFDPKRRVGAAVCNRIRAPRRHPPPARRRDRPHAPAGHGPGRPADDCRCGTGRGCGRVGANPVFARIARR